MAAPIPVIASATASRILVDSFVNLERSQINGRDAPLGLVVPMSPVWTNKYQVLLYGAAARRGYAVVGVARPEDLAHVFWPGPIVLHAHWFASIFKAAASEVEAAALLDATCEAILRFRDRTGAKLLWTAHNVFPHGNAFPVTFRRLRRWIFRTMDAVHVMQASHVTLLEAAYGAPAPKPFVVPHMLYSGSLIDTVDRIAARAHLGVPAHAFVFGFFGSIQPYKRVDLFLEAFERLAESTTRPVFAVVAGAASDRSLERDIALRWGSDARVRLLLRKIHDYEIQYVFRAADAMVFPYTESLNSGATMMAATFRTPCVAPRSMLETDQTDLGGIAFGPESPDGLRSAMAQCLVQIPQYDEDRLVSLAPARISERFFDALDHVVASDVDHGQRTAGEAKGRAHLDAVGNIDGHTIRSTFG